MIYNAKIRDNIRKEGPARRMWTLFLSRRPNLMCHVVSLVITELKCEKVIVLYPESVSIVKPFFSGNIIFLSSLTRIGLSHHKVGQFLELRNKSTNG